MAFNWFKKKDKTNAAEASRAPEQLKDQQQEVSSASHDDPALAQTQVERSDNGTWEPDSETTGSLQAQQVAKGGFFGRLKRGLTKTREILTTDIDELFTGKKQLDEELLEELEEALITSDIGAQTAGNLIQAIKKRASKINSAEALKGILREEIRVLLEKTASAEPAPKTTKPHVIMVVGVNGVGKTTTIGKLAALTRKQGKSVLIAAADTFRAAAVEQLAIWAQRAEADFVKHKENADPAAVAYDSIEAAQARGIDVVFVDTAGRLHTKINLMEELKKIRRTIEKKMPGAPHEVLLVLDATTGQNALSQARLFHEAIGVTGLALTKLDGTAKGGIVVRISQTLNLPLHYIGVGESIEDLQPFDAAQFVAALF